MEQLPRNEVTKDYDLEEARKSCRDKLRKIENLPA
jgi:hypothetical protein